MFGPFGTANVVVYWFASFEAVCAEFQCKIVRMTDATKLALKLPYLRWDRIESKVVAQFHYKTIWVLVSTQFLVVQEQHNMQFLVGNEKTRDHRLR